MHQPNANRNSDYGNSDCLLCCSREKSLIIYDTVVVKSNKNKVFFSFSVFFYVSNRVNFACQASLHAELRNRYYFVIGIFPHLVPFSFWVHKLRSLSLGGSLSGLIGQRSHSTNHRHHVYD